MTHFSSLGLNKTLVQNLETLNYKIATPIQELAIPAILTGKDFLGIAQTGTGKTAAFVLPILELLNRSKQTKHLLQALIITPTRELALQIFNNLKLFGKSLPLKFCCIFGGVKEYQQIKEIKEGAHILIATPGRLLDLYRKKLFSLKYIRFFVLDEADRMLDMGFLPDIRSIIKAIPNNRQNLFFSATFPKKIATLANTFLKDPIHISITPPSTVTDCVNQHLLYISKGQKLELLQRILKQENYNRVLVFSKTKFGAERIGRSLKTNNFNCCVLHSDKSQKERQQALNLFQQGTVKLLIATDIVSRGIDISTITHVINFDLPNEAENYIHRIGRTGRAGQKGTALSFCDISEKPLLKAIEKKMQERIPTLSVKHFWHDFIPAKTSNLITKKSKRNLRSSKNKQKKRLKNKFILNKNLK